VADPEQTGREPPLDRPTHSGASAPAIHIATTFAVTRVVKTLHQTPTHSLESRHPARADATPDRCRACDPTARSVESPAPGRINGAHPLDRPRSAEGGPAAMTRLPRSAAAVTLEGQASEKPESVQKSSCPLSCAAPSSQLGLIPRQPFGSRRVRGTGLTRTHTDLGGLARVTQSRRRVARTEFHGRAADPAGIFVAVLAHELTLTQNSSARLAFTNARSRAP
jgi:hypothetical protein